MQIVIPCAGESSRFFIEGYSVIKQLLKIKNKTIIEYVADNFKSPDAKYFFIFQKKHMEKWYLEIFLALEDAKINFEYIELDHLTDGAVNTALTVKDRLNPEEELIIANSDQWVDWNYADFRNKVKDVDGCMPIFIDEKQENKWSFVSLDEHNQIQEVRAKDAFTKNAVVGIYYFNKAKDFIKYGQQMIDLNKRVNGEFYVCPVFNELIAGGKKVISYKVNQMVGLGTPVDFLIAKEYFGEQNN